VNIILQVFSYFKENTLRLRFKYESFRAIYENNHSVFSESYEAHKHTVWAERMVLMLK